MNTIAKSSLRSRNSREGSALIVAVILGAAIALAVGSFIFIASGELRMANRTSQMAAVDNVAESGMEEALAVLNTQTANAIADPTIDPFIDSQNPLNTGVWNSGDYDGVSPNDRQKPFPNLGSSSQNVVSSASVLILATAKARQYYVVSKAVGQGPNTSPIEKYVWAFVRRNPLVPPGAYARKLIELKGTSVTIDAFHSSLGIYGAALVSPSDWPDAYQGKNIFSLAKVASATSTVDVGQADIYGNVATSGADPLATVGNTGIIGEWGDPNGTKSADQTATNFTAEFDLRYPPSLSTGIPKTAADITASFELGDPSTTNRTPWIYQVKASAFNSNQLYKIVGPVRIVIVPEASGSDGKISFSGSGGIEVAYMPQLFDTNAGGLPELRDPGVPALQIWTRGDIAMSGKGLINDAPSGTTGGLNQGNPLAVQIYGYATDTGSDSTSNQLFTFTGNQVLSATIYAPNANLKLGGGGMDDIDMMGAIVAKNITLNGKVKYHVDLDLANAENGKFGVNIWRELLTPSERNGSEMGRTYGFGL